MPRLDAATLRRWRRSTTAFVEEACYTVRQGKAQPARLWPEQREILEGIPLTDDGRIAVPIVVFSLPRRNGKSQLSRWIQLWRAFCFPGTDIYLVSTSKDSVSSIMLRELQKEIKASPVLRQFLDVNRDLMRDTIEIPKLGSRIKVLPQKPSALEGISIDILSLSELHRIPDPEIYGAGYVSCVDSGGTVVIDSILPAEDHWARPLFDPNLEGAYVILKQGREANFSPFVTEKALKIAEATMFPEDFAAFCLNLGASPEAGNAFTEEEVERAKTDYAYPLPLHGVHGILGTRDVAIFLGLDRSEGRRDNTVLVTVARAGDRFVVANEESFPESRGSDILEAIEDARERYGRIDAIALERFQCLDLAQTLEERGYAVEFISPSKSAQKGAFLGLKRLLAEGRIQFSAHGLLAEELPMFGYNASNGTFGGRGKHRGGPSDDAVYALGWALQVALAAPSEYVDPDAVKLPVHRARQWALCEGGFEEALAYGDLDWRGPGYPSSFEGL